MGQLLKCLFVSIPFLCCQYGYSQKTFTPSELISDIDSLNKKIMEIHPNPFTVIDSVSYFKEIEKVKKSINKPLTSYEFYRLLAPITIKIGDGHTGLTPDQNLMNINKLRFPFEIFIKGRQIFITKNYSPNNDIVSGAEVLKINGIPSSEVLSTLLKYLPGESERFTIAEIENYFPMIYRFVYGEHDEFSLELKQSNEIVSYKISAIVNEKQDIPEFMKPSSFHFDNDIAVIDLRNFASPDFTSFIDSAFTQFQLKNSKSLIIDLRYNGGGQASLADSLISYLTTKEYNSLKSTVFKITIATSDYVQQLQSMNFGMKKGNFYQYNGEPIKPLPRKNSFKGSVYVLTSSFSYSTAGFFANVIKCYNLGTIIGSETGQTMICYGDTYSYILPNTNLPSGIAKQKFVFCCAINEGQGVVPNYKSETCLSDKLKGIDTVMDFTIKMIKNKK